MIRVGKNMAVPMAVCIPKQTEELFFCECVVLTEKLRMRTDSF